MPIFGGGFGARSQKQKRTRGGSVRDGARWILVAACALCSPFVACSARAATGSQFPSGGAQVADATEAELNQRLKQIDDQILALQQAVREKGIAYHNFVNGAGSPQFIWQDDPAVTQAKRRRVASLVKVELREIVRQLESLEQHRDDLAYELEWLKLRTQAAAKLPPVAKRSVRPFHCAVSPVNPLSGEKVNLAQDFGTHRDKDTGIEWQSSGWWLSQIDAKVRVCAAGTIAYTGKVAGRGRVILVDHGSGNMTLYANLNDSLESKWTRGMKVPPGAELGMSRERLYFEVRQGGQAIDPRKALSPSGLSNFSL